MLSIEIDHCFIYTFVNYIKGWAGFLLIYIRGL